MGSLRRLGGFLGRGSRRTLGRIWPEFEDTGDRFDGVIATEVRQLRSVDIRKGHKQLWPSADPGLHVGEEDLHNLPFSVSSLGIHLPSRKADLCNGHEPAHLLLHGRRVEVRIEFGGAFQRIFYESIQLGVIHPQNGS